MLKPKKVIYRQNYMTSVLAVKQKAWIVFFIGTGDGQLIQVCIKSDFHLLLGKEKIRIIGSSAQQGKVDLPMSH